MSDAAASAASSGAAAAAAATPEIPEAGSAMYASISLYTKLFEAEPAEVLDYVVMVTVVLIVAGVVMHLLSLVKGSLTINTFGSMLGAMSTAALTYAALSKGNKLFVWHPILMTFGAVYIATAGIETVVRRKAKRSSGDRKWMTLLHWLLFDVAAASMILGLYAIYVNKQKPLYKHFASAHAWVGMVSLGFFLLNLCTGSMNTISTKGLKLTWVDWTHRIIGKVSYIGLIATVLSGHYNKVKILPEGWGGKLVLPDNYLTFGGSWTTKVFGETATWAFMGLVAAAFVCGVFPTKPKLEPKVVKKA
eukprot:CAMPEP_0197517024 /NCGR_PEP_ID=MMETSP1318-20131121/1991_1 /TAXON_ID=552666 /ORGANISM="Partenskyella glossopodia, Strain RCC365" /LENGTH=304 /DNA_ID=CAMNT_0043066251 /DNA_START=50 /DNA_END=964 /DNA_ORIENTATION=+